ncbi:MAG TPA: hypothetical protein DHW40_09695 [Microbacterium sp.]|nr:hypothetical protein [Microbacterium sp.]
MLIAAAVAGVFTVGGCASGPAVDLDEAKAWVDEVVASESDGPGAAGTGMMRIGPGGEAGVRFDVEDGIVLVRVDVRCFGDDDLIADVTVAVTSEDGVTRETDAAIPCDRGVHEIDADAAAATAVEIQATASTETYLHATVIQELVIERE